MKHFSVSGRPTYTAAAAGVRPNTAGGAPKAPGNAGFRKVTPPPEAR